VLASCFALVCFAAAVVVGLAAGNPPVTVLWRSILVMGGAWLVGLAVGALFQRTLEEHIEAHQHQHPMPGEEPTHAPAEAADDAEEPGQAEPASRAASQ
jgi:hypothetical protein